MIAITGGAGFIGSAVVAALNARGRADIVVVDDIDHPEKEHNLAPLSYVRLVGIQDFRDKVRHADSSLADISHVFHLGACSSTLELNETYLKDINTAYTKEIIAWSLARGIPIVYASSAAVYGDGSVGFSDNPEHFSTLTPLNPYGRSKLDVDIWAQNEGLLDRVVGLRYFNVYGPNENHKGIMRSMIAKAYTRLAEEGVIELFKSHRPDYLDGEQRRDFLYITDAVAMTLFFLDAPEAFGVFNIGTGTAHSWNEVAYALFASVNKPRQITYVDMPEPMRERYQYYTEAPMERLRSAGYTAVHTPLTTAIAEYVRGYLAPHKHLAP